MYRSDRWYLATTPNAKFYFSENVENVRKKFRGKNSAISKHECTDGQMVFSDYTKRRILLLRERGKTYARNFGTAAKGRYSSQSSRDFKVFIEVQAEV